MDARLAALIAAQEGAFGIAQARALGLSYDDVDRLVRLEEVTRVRQGAFVLSEAYAARSPDEQYRLRVVAVMLTRGVTDAASHHAGLAIWRVARFGGDLARIDVGVPGSGGNSRSGVITHAHDGAGDKVVRGTRTVSLALALVQTAAWSGIEAGVCSMDDALHGGRCTVADLSQAIDRLQPQRRARAAAALARVDQASESVGESRTRLVLEALGFTPVSQAVIRDGSWVARVDFLVDGAVVVEFDGLVKYEGHTGREALAREKARESRLVELGYEVVRVVWADLADPARLAARLRQAQARARARAALALPGAG